MNKFNVIRKKIENQLKLSEIEVDFIHSQLTWQWVLKLKPTADIPLQIAALGHDYERSFPDRERIEFYATYDEYKQAHAKKSARLIAALMTDNDFTLEEIKKTKKLIESHEIGGQGDAQILTDADSLAFFEGNARYYNVKPTGQNIKSKINFMYQRLSDNAKKLLEQIKFENQEFYILFNDVITDK
jgi:hypothetical protein